jgi:hypothetical protein
MTDAPEDLAAAAVSETLRQAGHRPAACAALMRLAGQALARLTSEDEAIFFACSAPALRRLLAATAARRMGLHARRDRRLAPVGQLGGMLLHALHAGAAAGLDATAKLLEIGHAGLPHAAAGGLGASRARTQRQGC